MKARKGKTTSSTGSVIIRRNGASKHHTAISLVKEHPELKALAALIR